MGFEGVPWMVGGGAQHSAEVGRVLAYVAFNGNEGVLGPGDLKVSQLGTPGASVRVSPGACAIPCRAAGQAYQSYAARCPTEDTVTIAATSASGSRRDLIVARVEDPWLAGEPWPDPANPTVGPYVDARVISGVSAAAIASYDGARDYLVSIGQSAIPLAGLNIPASTATILNSHIVDLRKVANPRRETVANHILATSGDALNVADGVYEEFPDGVHFDYLIPTWAVRVFITGFVEGVKQSKAGLASLRVGIYQGSTLVGATTATSINEDKFTTGAYDRRSYNVGGEIAIPAAYRGTTCRLKLEGAYQGAASKSFLVTDAYSSGQIQATFEERAL